MILGYDYLKNNLMMLDCANRSLQFQDIKIPLKSQNEIAEINTIDKRSSNENKKNTSAHDNSVGNTKNSEGQEKRTQKKTNSFSSCQNEYNIRKIK